MRANRLEAALANTEGIDPLLSETNSKTIDRIYAFRARAERTFHKCHKELRALKSPARPQANVSPVAKIGRNEPCPCKSVLRNEANSAAWIPPILPQEIYLQG